MISMIAAYAQGRVIAKAGDLPWRLPNDARYFQRVTSGHIVVMGRKTFESMGHPLPRRRNIVLTNNPSFAHEDVEVLHNRDEVLALDKAGNGEIFIVGGEQIYTLFLDVAERLYLTAIELSVEGDTFFPAWNPEDFVLVSSQPGQLDEKNTLSHTFYIYERAHGRALPHSIENNKRSKEVR
jgi:dihydrofolate reductase